MASDTDKTDRTGRPGRNRPASPVIDLPSTEIVALPKADEAPVLLPAAGAEPIAGAGESTPPDGAPDATASTEVSPEVIAAGPPVGTPTTASSPDALIGHATAPEKTGTAASGDIPPPPDTPFPIETPTLPHPDGASSEPPPDAARARESHQIDPSVFERHREPSILIPLIVGALAGIAASLILVFGLSALNLLPGTAPPDTGQRLAGVEASIRSLVERGAQGASATPDGGGLAERLTALEASVQDTRAAVDASRAAGAGSASQPEGALSTELDAVDAQLAQLTQKVSALEPQVATLGERSAALEPQVATLGERSGALEPQLADLARKADAAGQGIAELAQKLQAIAPQVGELSGKVDASAGQVGAVSEKQDALFNSVAALKDAMAAVTELPPRMDALARRQDELTTGFAGLLSAATAAGETQGRLDALAGRVDAVAQRQAQPAEDLVARRLALLDIADAALRLGRPFTESAAALARSGGGGVAPLEDVASGIPTVEVLAERARAALAGLPVPRKTGAAFLDGLADSARSLVAVTRADGAPAGATQGGGNARAAFVDRLRAGDIAAALAALDGMDEAGRQAVVVLAEQARRRLAAEQSLAAAQADLLAQAAKRS